MAAAVICECCGTVTEYNKARHIRAHRLASTASFMTKPEDMYDVCMDCYKKIEAMLKHKERKK